MNERFQVRPVNRPEGQFWEVFDTEKPDAQVAPQTPDQGAAQAHAAQLNTQFGRAPAPKKSHPVRNILLVVGGVFALLIAVGIAAAGNDPGTDATKGTSTPSPTAASSSSSATYEQCSDGSLQVSCPPAVEETTEPPADEPSVAKVGATQWFTYEDGLQVQVTKLARFKIGPYAAGGTPGGSGVIVTVTIRNGTKATFDANSVMIKVASGPNGDEADTVFDSDKGLSGGFEGSIPAGRVKTSKAGFAVPKAHLSQIQVEVQPSFEHDSSFFEGAAK